MNIADHAGSTLLGAEHRLNRVSIRAVHRNRPCRALEMAHIRRVHAVYVAILATPDEPLGVGCYTGREQWAGRAQIQIAARCRVTGLVEQDLIAGRKIVLDDQCAPFEPELDEAVAVALPADLVCVKGAVAGHDEDVPGVIRGQSGTGLPDAAVVTVRG